MIRSIAKQGRRATTVGVREAAVCRADAGHNRGGGSRTVCVVDTTSSAPLSQPFLVGESVCEHGAPHRRSALGRRAYYATLLSLFACCLLLAGCGKFFAKDTSSGGGGTTNSGNYLYVANNNNALNTVAAFSISNALLYKPSSSPYVIPATPNAVAVTPDNSLLFVGSLLGGVYAYAINTDGSITVQNGGSPVASALVSAMIVDPTGQWLIVLQDQGAGAGPIASVFSITAGTGVLTTAGAQIALNVGTTKSMIFTPISTATGTLMYAALGTGGVQGLTFNSSTGGLSTLSVLIPPSVSGYSDNALGTDLLGSYLLISEAGSNTVRVRPINADGGVGNELGSVAAGRGVGALLVDATGAYVYAANSADSTISAYALSTAGALTELTGSPFATGAGPTAMVEDNTDAYIAVACLGGTPDLQLFGFSTTTPGALTAVTSASTGSTTPAGAYAVAATH